MNKVRSSKKILLKICLLLIFLLASAFCVITYYYNKYDLDVNKLTSINNGVRVYSISESENTLYNTNRSIIEINTLPDYVKKAFISVEDKRFYYHNGYDLKRIVKAGLVNIADKSKSQGASTISQQLIKNALLTNEKTYSRKIKEIVLSIKMEKLFSKDEILEMYLNTIYFGSNAYGIENASLTYFNKSAKNLTLNEVCCLAGLIKSPKYYSPKNNLENSINRKNLVARLMYENNYISKDEYEEIQSLGITVTSSNVNCSYEEEAIYEACNILNITERELINNQYQIITFKNDELQKKVVEINNDVIGNAENANNCNLDSLTIVANKYGHVESYYAKSNYNLHNLKRQAASTLKPLAVYLPCIKHNVISPASIVLDEEINYNGFSPKNADNKFHGYITAKQALADSVNTTAVKLLDSVGVDKSKEMLTTLGINIDKSDVNLSLALGSTKNGVKLMDLLSAYTTLSNLGEYNKLCFVYKILDKHGNIIYEHENTSEQIVSKENCFLVNEMLKEAAKTGTAKRLNSLDLPLASKTGTAGSKNGNTDLYNITYSSEHAMLTWIADIKNIYLPNSLYSSSQPTDINKHICSYLYSKSKPKDFEQPENIVYAPYSLIEAENNHILMSPSKDELDRYIAYDYFKIDNLPIENINRSLNFEAKILNNCVNLSFFAEKNKSYKIYKVANNTHVLLKEVTDYNESINVCDYNIFNYDEVEYYITTHEDLKITDSIKIRPKDYLINKLNNELLSTKKKWCV